MYSEKFSAQVGDVIEQARIADEEVQVIVRFHSAGSQRSIGRLAAGAGAIKVNQEYRLIPATAVSLRPSALDELTDSDDVAEIWLDEVVHILLDVSTPHIRAPQVWEQLHNDGEGVTICVVDTGIDATHPDFAGRVGLTADFSGKGSAADGNGHGTHVASTAAGTGAASGGKYVGVAPGATIMAAKALADNGSGRMSNVMAGLEWAAQNGADVLNLSLGSRGNSDGSDALSTMCNAIVDLGKIMVVAAGNSGPRQSTIGSPGAAEQVITVGASDDQDSVARFSSRGPTADGRVKPDVVAPGSKIVAARAAGTSVGQVVDEYYTTATGTSMAAPHVAGLAALMLRADTGLGPAGIKKMLMATSVDINISENGQSEGDKYIQGDGRIDALTAVQYADTGQQPPPHKPSLPVPVPPPPNPNPPIGCMAAPLRILKLI
jgi:serine protease AprX